MKNSTLVLVHGRSQQGKVPEELRKLWLDTLLLGLGKSREHVLEDVDIVFPFYGDVLEEFTKKIDSYLPSDVLFRGELPNGGEKYLHFTIDIMKDVQRGLNLTNDQVNLNFTQDVLERGPQNWEWVQAILRAADQIPGVSASSIERFTRDVYLYMSFDVVRSTINEIVNASIPSDGAIVIGHSLGSIVAYDVLRHSKANNVPLFLTVGSPLGIGPIRRTLAPLKFPPAVTRWYNAFDKRDAVALIPLDKRSFDVAPAVTNYSKVKNWTENAHGIIGYLNDYEIATQIYDELSQAPPR